MSLRASNLSFSHRKAPTSATNPNLRPTSTYKSIHSTSTIQANRQPNPKEIMLSTQSSYHTSRARSSKYNSLTSTCWCLYDQNSKTELGFRKTNQREIASLTKIMTTLVGLELKKKYNLSPNILIRITESSTKNIGTSARLKANSWILLKDLFYGIMLPSGNDAAHLMAQFMGYLLVNTKKSDYFNPEKINLIDLTRESTVIYISEFVKCMNQTGERLGLEHTRFSNPHGLQNAMNISTAKDILTLSIYASKDAMFRAIMNAESHRYHQYSGDESGAIRHADVWENTNVLLREGWEGIKTGQTQSAGGCLASLKNGIYIVVLNCPDSLKRFTETKRLYEWYTEQDKDWRNSTSSSSFQF